MWPRMLRCSARAAPAEATRNTAAVASARAARRAAWNVVRGMGGRLSPTPIAGRLLLLVEPDLEAVAVLHHVVASLEPQLAALARLRLAARIEQLIAADDFGPDEALREVGVDLARGVHGALAVAQGPRAHLVGPHREERNQTEQTIAGAEHDRESVLAHAELGAERRALLGRQRHDLALEIGAQAHDQRVRAGRR